MGKEEWRMKIPYNVMEKSPLEQLRLNIQFFAQGGEFSSNNQTQNPPTDPPNDESISFKNQSELDSFVDKRIAKALETAKGKWEKEFATKLEKEKKEAERLAKLSATERKEAEYKKREEELNNRLKEIETRELKAETIKELNEKKLPASFADFLMSDTAENTLENIKVFKKSFDEAIEQAVNERLKGEPPQTGTENATKTSTAPDFSVLAQKNRIVGK